ncbi:GlcG/HbpS family heme-binding protein [Streptomyces sp. H39-S7]|uniref:GlcG/HbpS family heme-binding protein n=1 Tax=Streptomyces sp. H39-S7 TaxID=3004357 RepID=UPI0022AFAA97|nr:heme-binding protein [Streptomyces sp. H39-S7]MCZ4124639.1 heme-binding protein [Streptomyces sp. H39-S7]
MRNLEKSEAAVFTTRSISLAGAQRVIGAALAHAQGLDCRVSLVVIDAGGNVTAMARRDGTANTATTVALNKANTALTLHTATDVFGKTIEENTMLVSSLGSQPGIALIAGGLPLTAGGDVIGAIGVSGSRDGKDLLIARAGADALDPEG